MNMNVAAWPLSYRLELNWVICLFLTRMTYSERAVMHHNCKSTNPLENFGCGEDLVEMLVKSAQEFVDTVYDGNLKGIVHVSPNMRMLEYCQYFNEYLRFNPLWQQKGKPYEIPFVATPDDADGRMARITDYFAEAMK